MTGDHLVPTIAGKDEAAPHRTPLEMPSTLRCGKHLRYPPPHIATRQKGQRTGRPAVRGQPDSLRPNAAIFRLTAYRAVNDKPCPGASARAQACSRATFGGAASIATQARISSASPLASM